MSESDPRPEGRGDPRRRGDPRPEGRGYRSANVGVLRYGVVPYGQALAHQLALRERLQEERTDHSGWIVCLEHEPVVTLGKRGRETDIISPGLLKERGVELFRVDRGGEATYHGPGQLVVYPIVRLADLKLGVVDLVRNLAQALADTLNAEFGIETRYDPEHPGLWTLEEPSRKMGSVGMRVSRGVSTHGAALNLLNDMIPFSWIVACGMPNAPMTRLRDYVEEPFTLESFREAFLGHLATALNVTLVDEEAELPSEGEWVQSLELPAQSGDSDAGVGVDITGR